MTNPNNLSSLLHSALNTIKAFSEKLNSYEPSDEILCHYCAHFPMGGDGKCGYKNPTKAECNFEWRYAKQLKDVIKEIENDLACNYYINRLCYYFSCNVFLLR